MLSKSETFAAACRTEHMPTVHSIHIVSGKGFFMKAPLVHTHRPALKHGVGFARTTSYAEGQVDRGREGGEKRIREVKQT